MFRILTIFAISLSILCVAKYCEAAPAAAAAAAPALLSEGKSRQYIAPLPGLVPVYIRPGETPLEDINLELAEAFDSYARKHGGAPEAMPFPSTNDIGEAAPARGAREHTAHSHGRGGHTPGVRVVHEIPYQIPVVVAAIQQDAGPRRAAVRPAKGPRA